MLTIGSINISSSSNTLSSDTMNETRRGQDSELLCIMLNLSAIQIHDESEDLVGNNISNIFINVIHIVLLPLFFFIGFPSNVVNMVVFFRHGLRQRINLCLFCLSLMDLTYVIFALVTYVENFRLKDFNTSYRKFGHVLEFLIINRLVGLYSGSGLSSQFVSAVIAGERCLCVVWPLKSSAVLKTKTVGVFLLVGILFILGGRLVIAMKFGMICVEDIMTGLKHFLVGSSEFYEKNKTLINNLEGAVFGMGLPVLSVIFVTITTVITALNLQKSTEFQKESSSSSAASSARNVAVTRMLIFLSIQFIVLNSPNMLFRMSLIFLPELSTSGDWANLYAVLITVIEFCHVLSASTNFLVYYIFGSKYRESVLGMLCRCTGKTS